MYFTIMARAYTMVDILDDLHLASSKQYDTMWNVPFSECDYMTTTKCDTRPIIEETNEELLFGRILEFFNVIDTWIVEHLGKYMNMTSAYATRIYDALVGIEAQEKVHAIVYRDMKTFWESGDRHKCKLDMKQSMNRATSVDVEDIATFPDGTSASLAVINFVFEWAVLPIVFDALYAIKPVMTRLVPDSLRIFQTNDDVITDETIHGEMWRLVLGKCDVNLKKLSAYAAEIFECVVAPIIGAGTSYYSVCTARELYMARLNFTACVRPLRYQVSAQSVRPFEGSRIGYTRALNDSIDVMVAEAVKESEADAISRVVAALKRQAANEDEGKNSKKAKSDVDCL